jgi:hypothetical protein
MSNNINDIINDTPFKYKGIVFFVFLLAVGVAGYTFYNYYVSSMLIAGYSYLSEDLKNIDYLFEHSGSTKEECLTMCQKDFLCKGLTFDASLNKCYGLRSGKLRSDEPHIYAWVKDISNNTDKDNLILNWTKEYKVISHRMIPVSPLINVYALNFWITVDDWYQNYGLWRNIIYQGSELTEKYLNTSNWGDVTNKISKQKFGVWLAPYSNNIRIVIGTKIPYNNKYIAEHPANEVCKSKKCPPNNGEISERSYYDLEYIDIKNINIGEPVMISIVLENRALGIYHNGKLTNNIILDGTPVPLNSDCYIKLDKSFTGSFMYFRVWANKISSHKIQELYNTELKDIKTNKDIVLKNNHTS